MVGPGYLCVLLVIGLFVNNINAVALDGTCTADCECTDAHTTCQSGTCACATGYAKISAACKASIGTTCTITSNCDTTTEADTICDTTAASPVCKIKSGGDCTNVQTGCLSNAACNSNICVCTAATHTEETSSTLCKKKLGESCTTTADCDASVAKTVCDTTVALPVCKLGSGGDCSGANSAECMSNSACSSGACVCDATHPVDANLLCVGKADSACVTDAGCVSNAACISSTCSCMTGYLANTAKTSCLGDYGHTCTASTECDTDTNTVSICSNAGVCAIKAGSSCAGKTDKCVVYAGCTGASDTCACGDGYTKDGSNEHCEGAAGKACSSSADCGASLYCDLALTVPVCRKAVGDCGGDQDNCVTFSSCTGTTCTCATGYTEDSTLKICQGAIDKPCNNDHGCNTGSDADLVCDTTKTCKKKQAATCTTTDQCVANSNCEGDCKVCTCTGGVVDDKLCSGAGAVIVSLLVLLSALVVAKV
ncbi:TENX-like protein [Mya arenaria]|uniref:TENX-like protein n=1 Tax=Mya arenaria TaxID=6604 RepID=A0ABY7DWH9_MYAAR|nr:platelet endothelial aggregation receptor 1-like [Mya arenaria]WAR01187.1 TENX-like protein [Mya arenaria]